MSNSAIIHFEDSSKKFVASYKGLVLIKSFSREHIQRTISEGRCNKANKFNVTGIVGVEDVLNPDGKIQPHDNVNDKFTIDERFDFLTDFTLMVADGTAPSLVVTGEGGLGKTHTIMAALESFGMKNADEFLEFKKKDPNEDDDDYMDYSDPDGHIPDQYRGRTYTVIKGHSSDKALYRALYENRTRTIIFDDCDSIQKSGTAVNLLKAALDSYAKRTISWHAESAFGNDDLPQSFEFTGGVIFISNMSILKIDQALRTRAMCVDLSMSADQKIERMATLIKSEDFLSQFSPEIKEEALAFLSEIHNQIRELSLRTLITTIKIASRGGEWKRRAEYQLSA